MRLELAGYLAMMEESMAFIRKKTFDKKPFERWRRRDDNNNMDLTAVCC
jgi:hypothetical protein